MFSVSLVPWKHSFKIFSPTLPRKLSVPCPCYVEILKPLLVHYLQWPTTFGFLSWLDGYSLIFSFWVMQLRAFWTLPNFKSQCLHWNNRFWSALVWAQVGIVLTSLLNWNVCLYFTVCTFFGCLIMAVIIKTLNHR